MLFLLLPDSLQSADIMGPQPFLDNHGLRATLPSHQLPTIIFLCPIPHRDMDFSDKAACPYQVHSDPGHPPSFLQCRCRSSLLPPNSGLAKRVSIPPVPWILRCNNTPLRRSSHSRWWNQGNRFLQPNRSEPPGYRTQAYCSKRQQWDSNCRPAAWGVTP